MKTSAVLGAGSWGTALAVHLARADHDVRLWARDATFVEGLRIERTNGRYLPGISLPDRVTLADSLESAVTGAHYAASKAGLFALTRTLAQELAPHGVTVNALSPAAIQGPSLDEIDAESRRRFLATLPVGRFGLETEVAAAAVYLASEAAGFTTGATLDLNGGKLMR